MKKQKVFVGLSGGVDSSVAALRLTKQGYEVIGVFIKVWQPDFLKCDWESERLDAMRVAAHLGIPFLTCDAAEAYKKDVGEYFINEYLAGRTPNPDVMCNRYVKFGAFWDFAKSHGADFIATGHYARVVQDGGSRKLLRGVDPNKDQSYFLWTLTDEDLEHVLFPVGDTTKENIRQEAKAAGLPTAIKKDSQGVCFLGHIDIPEFLSHFTKLETGPVVNRRGEKVGEHQGALTYTLGQRHGFTVFEADAGEPSYVVGKDLSTNSLIVDREPPVVPTRSTIKLGRLNWRGGDRSRVEASFRYRQAPTEVDVFPERAELTLLDKEIERPAAGQSVVFYDGEECLGGAVIE